MMIFIWIPEIKVVYRIIKIKLLSTFNKWQLAKIENSLEQMLFKSKNINRRKK